MRDFRNAKAMAQTLRGAFAAKGLKITISQSLELVAEMFGVADWNTLAAKVRAGEKSISREKISTTPLAAVGSNSVPPFSATFAATLHRALFFATKRKHEYATLEHLLLALIDDADASVVMKVCNANPGALAEKLVDYLDNELKSLVIGNGADPKPTAAFQRVVQRAELRGQEQRRSTVTGANTLESILSETQSPAARFLGEQGMTRQHLSSIVTHGGTGWRG
jgi:hypothetical protein